MNVLERKMLEDGVPMTKEKRAALQAEAKAIDGEIIEPPKRGQNGMRRSRKGARQRVSVAFAAGYEDAFEKYGVDVFDHLARNEPANFAKIGLGLMPKEIDMSVTRMDDLSNEQLLERVRAAFQKAITLGIVGDVGDAGSNDTAERAEQALTGVPGDGTTKT